MAMERQNDSPIVSIISIATNEKGWVAVRILFLCPTQTGYNKGVHSTYGWVFRMMAMCQPQIRSTRETEVQAACHCDCGGNLISGAGRGEWLAAWLRSSSLPRRGLYLSYRLIGEEHTHTRRCQPPRRYTKTYDRLRLSFHRLRGSWRHPQFRSRCDRHFD